MHLTRPCDEAGVVIGIRVTDMEDIFLRFCSSLGAIVTFCLNRHVVLPESVKPSFHGKHSDTHADSHAHTQVRGLTPSFLNPPFWFLFFSFRCQNYLKYHAPR